MTAVPRSICSGLAVAALVCATGLGTSSAATAASTPAPKVADAPVAAIETPITGITAPVEDIETTEVTGDSTTIVIDSDVLFEFDSATLTDLAKDHLADIATQLESAQGAIAVDGYTDNSGSQKYNKKLSEERAQAVVDELTTSLPDAEFDVTGHGEDDPVESNQSGGKDDPQAMAKNRRVSISYS